ncbi:hypothetical protein K458DRAFT_408349 [Lentithecium fluviatile CBS 122367]|uniref:Uncharacterized protein n=1 Tax=Lentithecium fluviatile CBS 122367 TaxID=1168545 RepID=A0A6G1IM62_9PLEO|nr:hypothetical protein K458DRAFT_408349 [Lentithecium fluviatile CBS 122367]
MCNDFANSEHKSSFLFRIYEMITPNARTLLITLLLITALVGFLHDANANPTLSGKNFGRTTRHTLATGKRSVDIDDLSAWKARCLYAVSGMYCKIQRILFYVVAILAFRFRFHRWLTVIDAGFLITYSTTAAIHGLALTFDPAIGRDSDYLVLTKLMYTYSYVATCFTFYAPRIFNAPGRLTIALWTGIVAAAAITMTSRIGAFVDGYIANVNIEVCDSTGICANTCNLRTGPSLFHSKDEEMLLYCRGPPIDIPSNISSSTADLFTIASAIMWRINDSNKDSASYKKSSSGIIWVVVISIILQTTTLNWILPPPTARDLIFIRLTKNCNHGATDYLLTRILRRLVKVILFFVWPLQYLYLSLSWLLAPCVLIPSLSDFIFLNWMPGDDTPLSTPSRRRLRTAKALALSWYIWAGLGYLMWPALFLYGLITGEKEFKRLELPEQGTPLNAGQWSPWVNVGLGLLVATVHRIFHPESKAHSIWVQQGVLRSTEAKRPWWVFGWEEAWYWYTFVHGEWVDLVTWWKNPMRASWARKIMSNRNENI